MKKNIKRFLIISIYTLISCNSKQISFKVWSVDNKLIKYKLSIPKGYVAKTIVYENERIKTYTYPDSSSIFISDNITPSSFYPEAYIKYGGDLNIKFLANDTITINGIDSRGKYWEDRKIKHIIYGYRKVPGFKKDFFDKILNKIITNYL